MMHQLHMKSGKALVCAVFAAAAMEVVGGDVFDEGGFSIDFASASIRRFAGGAKFTESSGYPVSVTNRPFGYVDDKFAVSEGQCGVVSFGWRRDSAYPCDVPTKDYRFEFVYVFLMFCGNYFRYSQSRKMNLRWLF